jgi:gamma-glutamyltranspeptidase/glutathione hydrolase
VTPADGGYPRYGAGASGGRRILASVYQMLAFTLDSGMTLEDAAHQPRIDVSGPDGTSADARLPEGTLDALAAVGPLTVVEHGVLPLNFACPNMVRTGQDRQEGISDAASPWSAAVAAN